MKNTLIPVTDNKLRGFKKAAVIGTGVITDNADSSITFSSSDTNSNCYMYWQVPAVFGETIKLRVKAKQLSGANITSTTSAILATCPRFAVQWRDKNGNYKGVTDGYVTSTDLQEYELAYTVNQPVKDGDIIICSFGHYRSSLISGTFSEAQVLVENSSLSVRQDIIGGVLNIEASAAGSLPELSYNLNYTLLQPDSIAWINSTTIQIKDARLKGVDGTRMSPLWNIDVALNDPASSDFYKYRVYAGYLNRTNGTINIQFYDATTNAVVDFKTDKTTLIPVIFNIFNI